MPTLQIGRLRFVAIEVFKILHVISPKYLKDLVCFKCTIYSFMYENLVETPRPRATKYGKASFRYEAANVWNSLPDELRKCANFKEFGRLIRT